MPISCFGHFISNTTINEYNRRKEKIEKWYKAKPENRIIIQIRYSYRDYEDE